jgi:hypothetical protein
MYVTAALGNRYLKERDLDWAYWPLDGQKGPSREWKEEETYGILNTTWSGFAYQPLLDVLKTIMTKTAD